MDLIAMGMYILNEFFKTISVGIRLLYNTSNRKCLIETLKKIK